MEPLMAEEKQQSRQASLTLQVMNGNELESGRAAKCLFSENGGDIGHTPECHWQVQDRAGKHCCACLYRYPARRSLLPAVPDAGTDD